MGYAREGRSRKDVVKGVRKAGCGGRERKGEGGNTTREDTRKEEGGRKGSSNPDYVSRYRNDGKEKNIVGRIK